MAHSLQIHLWLKEPKKVLNRNEFYLTHKFLG